jgi:PAS domain S-box-containing protein
MNNPQLLIDIFESVDTPFFAVDCECRYMVFNRCHVAMMKAIYNVDVEQGECILNYLSGPGDRESAKMDFDRAMKGETFIRDSYAGDEKFNRRYFAIHHNPILNSRKAVIGDTVIAWDVTERIQIQENAKKREVDFRIMTDYTYDWEIWMAPDGVIIYMTPACERITGYTVDEFIKNPRLLRDIIYPEDWLKFSHHLGVIDSGEPYCAEYRIITRSGNIRWIEHKCQAVYDDGKWMGRRSSNRDTTERKELTIGRERFIHELRTALDEVQILRGFLPICAYCKKIRNDDGYWDQIESYISKHSQAVFSHGICPECSKKYYPE